MTFPMKNSVLDNFPPCPPAHPPWKVQFFFVYFRLAFSDSSENFCEFSQRIRLRICSERWQASLVKVQACPPNPRSLLLAFPRILILSRKHQEPLNTPFLNGLFSSGFSRGKTAP